uniref:RNA-dependent RNA polymerase n=1 Tax=Plasmopara viticola lesion associated narnavirus 10 TaxID=2719493 RepID=A0A6G9RTG0_9VIRU|nr:RNA-dependent RNA polymerase [Plasmopara viticola lesion associated narnavirus 10]
MPTSASGGYGLPLKKWDGRLFKTWRRAGLVCPPVNDDQIVVDGSKRLRASDWFLSAAKLRSTQRGGRKAKPFKYSTKLTKLTFLNQAKPWCFLSSPAKKRLSDASPAELERIDGAWACIEDAAICATPEAFFDEETRRFNLRLWKWYHEHVAHGGLDSAIKLWKRLLTQIKFTLAGEGVDPYNDRRTDIILFEGNNFRPSALTGYWGWLPAVLSRDTDPITRKAYMTRLAALIFSSRGMPTPTKPGLVAGLNTHGEVVCGERDFKESDRLSQVSYLVGQRLALLAMKCSGGYHQHSTAHLSMTNSASYEGPRRSGGRAYEVGPSFAFWLNQKYEGPDKSGSTWFGYPYHVRHGMPRAGTMCRNNLRPDITAVDSSRIGFEELDLQFLESGEMRVKLQTPFEGFDEAVGAQLLQFSIETGIQDAGLVGDPYIPDEGGAAPGVATRPFCARVSPVGEGGLKARSVTADEGWVTQLLSPWGHEMISWLTHLPQCRSGASAASQAYEFVKDGGRNSLDKALEGGCKFVTADATQASEYLEWSVTKPLLRGWCNQLPIQHTSYVDICIDALHHPTQLEGGPLADQYDWQGCITKRGCLMGRPGTKTALMLTLTAVQEMALLEGFFGRDILSLSDEEILTADVSKIPGIFRTAGDDQLMVRPEKIIDSHRRIAKLCGVVIPETSWMISGDIGLFSEEIIYWGPQTKFAGKGPLWEREYFTTPHVDALKTRLFSPVTRVTLARDETNPALGKGSFFAKKMSWIQGTKYPGCEVLKLRWRLRFNTFVDWNNLFTYLPEQLGGLGLTCLFDGDETDLVSWVMSQPAIIASGLIAMLEPNCPPTIRASILAFRTNTSYRGLLESEERLGQIRGAFLSMDCADNLDDQGLKEILKMDDETWSLVRHRNKLREAKKVGYISLSEMVAEAKRPDYIKELLMRERTIIDNLPETLAYFEYRRLCVESAIEDGDTLESFLKRNEGLNEGYKELRDAYAKRKWLVELFAADTIRPGAKLPGFMKPPTMDPRDLKGFNLTSWDVRLKKMQDHLASFWPEDRDILPKVEGFDALREALRTSKFPFHEDVYVPRSRLGPMCSLSVDMIGVRNNREARLLPPLSEDYPPMEMALRQKAEALNDSESILITAPCDGKFSLIPFKETV